MKPASVLCDAVNQRDLKSWLSTYIKRYQASHFAYVQLPKPLTLLELGIRPRRLTNLPEAFVAFYDQNDGPKYPVARSALVSGAPLYALPERRTRYTTRLQSEGRRYGQQHWSLFPVTGYRYDGFLVLTSNQADGDFPSLVREQSDEIMELTRLVHVLGQGDPELLTALSVPGLSDRLLTYARLKAQGLTSGQISAETHVKPDTVDKGLAALCRKVGARNVVELTHLLTRLSVI